MRTKTLAGALLLMAGRGAHTTMAGQVRGRFDRPQRGFAPAGTLLRPRRPERAGVDPAPITAALRRIESWTEVTPDREHPMYAGAVALLAHDGVVLTRTATGHRLRYADAAGTELPAALREPARADSIFDIASMTKLFTSIAVLQQVEDGHVELEAPVAKYLPAFAAGGKAAVTVRQLLTHTSGLQAAVRLWELPAEERIPHVMSLEPLRPPGRAYTYSDPNMIALGELVQRVAGVPLDEVVAERITGVLAMGETGYTPPASKLHRIAATEYQDYPPRGMVRGEVHDENAWALGGVAGHAGLFSTVDDLAVLGQAILNGGVYAGGRILGPRGMRAMLTDFNTFLPEHSHGLGAELDQPWYMAGLTGPRSAGHTGFTGTSMVLDPASRSIVILLTNRVHPTREWGPNNPARSTLAQGLARALAVPPRHGVAAWSTTTGSREQDSKLVTDSLGAVTGDVRVSFEAFVDTGRTAADGAGLTVEFSPDGARNWHPVLLHATGAGSPRGPRRVLAGSGHRRWWRVHGRVRGAALADLRLRWRCGSPGRCPGRGVVVDGITVSGEAGVLLDGKREARRLNPDGWSRTER